MKKHISIMLAAMMVMDVLLVSCGSIPDNRPSYKKTISIMSVCEADNDEGDMVNAPADVYYELIAKWQQNHPDVKLNTKETTTADLASYACMQHLPDVFMLDSKTGRTFANYGFILDITNYIIDPDYEDCYYIQELAPYSYYGRLAAYPVLTKSNAAVIYYRSLWKEYGYDDIPDAWDELEVAGEKFRDAGYKGAIAMGDAGGSAAVRTILSPAVDASGGLPWLQKMIDKDEESMFYDREFVTALETAQDVMCMRIFGDDHYSMSAADAVSGFIDSEYPAVLVYGDDIYRVLEQIKKTDHERYSDLGFAALPALPGQTEGTGYMAGGISYGLYVNSEVALDPEKLELCIDLCRYLTGPEYANTMAEKWGRTCFAKADELSKTDYKKNCSDVVLQRLTEYLDTGMQSCPDLTQYFHGSVWSACGDAFSSSDRTSVDFVTPEIAVSRMQNNYEQNYLMERDFSKASVEDGENGREEDISE